MSCVIMIDNSKIYVGLDLGGTLSKVAVLTREQRQLPVEYNCSSSVVCVGEKEFRVFTASFLSVELAVAFVRQCFGPLESLEVGVTGGGAVKYDQLLRSAFADVKLDILNQFDSNVKGLEFVRRARVPVTVDSFRRSEKGEISHERRQAILDELQSDILFVSLGTGVNYQKYGRGQKGYERKKAEDISTASTADGYLLAGTSLGAGFLMGLGRLMTGERDFAILLRLMQEKEEMVEVYRMVLTNLMQMALQLSVLHKTPNILPSGSLLSYVKGLEREFQEALKLELGEQALVRNLVNLKEYQGFLGALGVLSNGKFGND